MMCPLSHRAPSSHCLVGGGMLKRDFTWQWKDVFVLAFLGNSPPQSLRWDRTHRKTQSLRVSMECEDNPGTLWAPLSSTTWPSSIHQSLSRGLVKHRCHICVQTRIWLCAGSWGPLILRRVCHVGQESTGFYRDLCYPESFEDSMSFLQLQTLSFLMLGCIFALFLFSPP